MPCFCKRRIKSRQERQQAEIGFFLLLYLEYLEYSDFKWLAYSDVKVITSETASNKESPKSTNTLLNAVFKDLAMLLTGKGRRIYMRVLRNWRQAGCTERGWATEISRRRPGWEVVSFRLFPDRSEDPNGDERTFGKCSLSAGGWQEWADCKC